MTGDELVRELQSLRPDQPIIVASGYADGVTSEWLEELGILRMLSKPLLPQEIAQVIREVFDGVGI